MVYFDGGEDVDRRRFTYYVTRFQEKAVSKFRRPLVHMGTIMTHLLWHSFSRSSTVDVYLATIHGAIQAGAKIEKWPTVRQHIDHSVDYMLSIRQDLMPGELGWFGIWARGKEYDGLQLDEFEYLMGKSLAYDAPVSLETGFGQMESTPLTPQLLEIFRVYDDLRMRRAVDEGTRKLLAEKGKDFALVRSGGRPRFVAVTPVAQVGGGREVRACIGAMDGGTVATLWHSFREAEVLLEIAPDAVRVADLAGKPLRPRVEAGKALLAADSRRTTLFFAGRTPEQVEALLAGAVVRRKPAVEVRVEAEAYTRCEGSLAKGSTVGIQESEASGDVVVPTQAPNRDAPQPWFCEYTVNIPDEGRWSLWARVRYPSRTDDSFGIVLPGEKVTLSMEQVLGNCGASGGQWHWSGRGGGSTAEPPGQPITFRLKKGAFTFRIYAREGSGNPATAPRLDALCLTDNGEPPER